MLLREVLHLQYVGLAILGGSALLVFFILAFWPFWQPRRDPQREDNASGLRGMLEYMPWVLIITIVGTIAAGLIWAIALAFDPPNW